jgi:hypothetical protein
VYRSPLRRVSPSELGLFVLIHLTASGVGRTMALALPGLVLWFTWWIWALCAIAAILIGLVSWKPWIPVSLGTAVLVTYFGAWVVIYGPW